MKYYVEIFDYDDYVVQSQCFNTVRGARNWLKNIDYVREELGIAIMQVEDNDNEDISVYEEVRRAQ